jgi:FHA domain
LNISLVHVKPDGSSREVSLSTLPKIVGRGEETGIRIPVGTVSRQHCEIWLDEDEDALMVKDLGSSNGTFVNGKRTSETELSPGDLLSIGPSVFVVRMDGFPAEIDATASYKEGSAIEGGPMGGAEAGSGTKTSAPIPAPKDGPSSSEGSSMIDFDFDLDDEEDDQPSL